MIVSCRESFRESLIPMMPMCILQHQHKTAEHQTDHWGVQIRWISRQQHSLTHFSAAFLQSVLHHPLVLLNPPSSDSVIKK